MFKWFSGAQSVERDKMRVTEWSGYWQWWNGFALRTSQNPEHTYTCISIRWYIFAEFCELFFFSLLVLHLIDRLCFFFLVARSLSVRLFFSSYFSLNLTHSFHFVMFASAVLLPLLFAFIHSNISFISLSVFSFLHISFCLVFRFSLVRSLWN